ncbi:MAG TPA: acetate--CoA ligase family protein [Acidimicrobiales bacterium]|nr:acetate--CoA ligase family protein [Acidimicrobiales bacterium]
MRPPDPTDASAALAGIERLLSPRSIALVGASNNEESIGGWVFANLARAFSGPLYPVHPRDPEIQGYAAYPSVAALPEAVDLAVVVVPAPSVPTVIAECAAKGVGGAVVITAGFAESGSEGAALQERVADIARASGLRVVGPNCIGFMNLFGGVMANFAIPPTEPLPTKGPVALVSQSGGFGSYISTKAFLAGLGLGWFVTTGNESDVNVTTVLRYLVERPETRVLMVFSETLRQPGLFIDTACRAAELDKPIVVLKAGRSEVAAKAAMSHTASLVGSAEVFDAVARQYGIFVVETMEEMLDLGMIFQDGRRVRDRRVAIMTTSGGAGVLLADACTKAGLTVPELPAAEQEALLELMPKPFYGSTANPVDTTAQVANVPGAYEQVLEAVVGSSSVDMFAGVTWAIPGPTNDAFVANYQLTDKPVALTSTAWLDDFQKGGVPTYTDPQRAANALGAVATQSLRAAVPVRPSQWSGDSDRAARVRGLLSRPRGQRALLESAAKLVLAAYGIPVTREELVNSPEGAARAAARIGGAVALKAMSYQLPHKTEAGAIRLGVGTESVQQEYRALISEVSRRAPEASIEGVLVQEMVPARLELTCGMHRDQTFGPIVAVGLGGILVEILSETALLRPPFDIAQAAVAVGQLAGGRLITSGRGLSDAEQMAVAGVMVGLGDLALEFDEVAEVDVNPLRVADGGAVAADALIVLN